MTVANEDNLQEIARLAAAEKARGIRTIDFLVEAQYGFAKHLKLWEGAVGLVVGRKFCEDPDKPPVPGFPQPRNVKYFVVRCEVASIENAWRRRQTSELRQFGPK